MLRLNDFATGRALLLFCWRVWLWVEMKLKSGRYGCNRAQDAYSIAEAWMHVEIYYLITRVD